MAQRTMNARGIRMLANFAGSWGWKRRPRVSVLLTLFRVSPTASSVISEAIGRFFWGRAGRGGARVVNWRLQVAKTPLGLFVRAPA